MYIYLIVNHVTGKYYVGQHKGSNLQHYLQQKFSEAKHRLKARSHIYNSIRKHGREAFTIHALLSDIQTRPELDQKERDFISFLKSQDPEYGYNICQGGEGFTGPHSEESKQKQRFAILGRKHTPEAIAKMRLVPKSGNQLACLDQTGVKRSPETRAKLKKRTDKQKSAWKNLLATNHNSGLPVGYQHTLEARLKISEAKKGKPAAATKNMAGQYLNGIEVLQRAGSRNGKAAWLCHCRCGNEFVTTGEYLRNGHTKSCGCLRKTSINA